MIRLAHPLFTREDLRRLWPLLASGRLVQGESVARFEGACRERLGVRACIAVSSGTAALHLALLAAGVGPGRRVAVPAFGWPSAANMTERLGGALVAVDIDPDTLNVGRHKLASLDPGAIDVMVPIHLFGLAVERRLFGGGWADVTLVEDAACAFGATDRDGVSAGTWGRFGCFSLHARKGLATGEGGLVSASSADDRARIERLRNHGLDGPGHFVEPGYNYRLNEMAAVLGLGQLERFDDSLARRRVVARRYCGALSALSGVTLPEGLSQPGHTFQSFVVGLADGVDRTTVLEGLRDRSVEATVGTFALHLQPYYRERYGWRPDDFPVARWAHEKLIALPMHEQLGDDEVDRVVEALDELC